MEQKEITQNNRLIAEFMEYPTKLTCKNLTDELCFNKLRYNSSWSLLMPVVNKISNTHIEKLEFFNGKSYIINMNKSLYVDYDITGVYGEIVEFINWYNENKSFWVKSSDLENKRKDQ